jgi:beta-galactosidase
VINSNKIKKIVYGGDYNPEQWGEDIWEEDMRLFALAGIDIVTLNVFSWAELQTDDVTYRFEKLDKIMDLVSSHGLKVCLATSTGAHPAWMAKKYPDILRTEFNGMKRKFGGRHNSCPNSQTYRKFSVALAKELALRYKGYDNIVAWHISNEFGGECYCGNCEKAFRVWLKQKYKTIKEVNRVWNTSFWGHTFYDWDEIVLPNLLSEHFADERTMFQGISLDYRRFNSDSLLACYRAEYEAIKAITPDIPVTTNLMGFYKPLDYKKWAEYMDFVSWDSYPSNTDSISKIALNHDLIRGLKAGMPFVLMEQTPSVTNWQSYNALKRPGVMRLWSYQAAAHGADAIMFFQMRRSIGACEKYHGAVIDHVGNEHTRVFREVTLLGEELKQLGDKTLGAVSDAKTAILFDWDNWWALEYSAGPSCELKYLDEILNYYTALHEQNIPVDIIGTEDELNRYKIVIAPLMYMTKGGYDEKIREYVNNGGTFLTTFFSGIVDEHDLVITGGYPGKLRDILGIWVEENDALPNGDENSFIMEGKTYPAKLLCDIMHLEGAKAISFYEKDFYGNTPCITKNIFGKGTAYYVGTRSTREFYREFLRKICEEKEVLPVLITPSEVEAVRRIKGDKSFVFVLNHSSEEKIIYAEDNCLELLTGTVYEKGCKICLKAKEVLVLESTLVK